MEQKSKESEGQKKCYIPTKNKFKKIATEKRGKFAQKKFPNITKMAGKFKNLGKNAKFKKLANNVTS